jgi:glycosyltransferase involved in cell wall biosynthesis
MNVSVVIPVRDRDWSIKRALYSVDNQSLRPSEVIVVDDGSADHTEAVVRAYPGVRYVRNRRTSGPAGARNTGIDEASGDCIAFLDSDDTWYERHLEGSVRHIEKHGLHSCYSLWSRIRGDSTEYYPDEWLDILINDLQLSVDGILILLGTHIAEYMILKPFWCFHIDTLVAKRSALVNCGMFDESLSTSEDMELSFRLLLGGPSGLQRCASAVYREGQDNLVALSRRDFVNEYIHRQNTAMAFRKIARIMELSDKIEDKAVCRALLGRKIAENEILH